MPIMQTVSAIKEKRYSVSKCCLLNHEITTVFIFCSSAVKLCFKFYV